MKKLIYLLLLLPLGSGAQEIISTIAGTGVAGFSGDGGPATNARVNSPAGIIKDGSGNVIFCDAFGHSIRKISPAGIITTIAGNGSPGYSGDGGPATAATVSGPAGIAIDTAGNILVAEYGNHVIRKINTSGIISTIAGNGTPGFSGDGGPATAATFNGSEGICVDNAGNIYIGDGHNQRIRKINTSGIITTIAGTGVSGYNGDGIPAASAQLSDPWGVIADTLGNIYIADQDNNRIRKIDASGIISTIAGTGVAGFSGNGGPATTATLRGPCGLYIRKSDYSIFIADRYNYFVRQINPSGVINAYAGTGVPGFNGDGIAATASKINFAPSIYIDNEDKVYIPDYSNSRVRLITNICNSDIVNQPVSDTVFEGDNATFTVTSSLGATGYQWQENPGSGFVNLANVWPYGGVLTNTLTINHASIFLNNTQYRCIISYETHCPDTSNAAVLVIKLPSGLNSIMEMQQIIVSPNPASDYITISMPDAYANARLELINAIGQNIYNQLIEEHITSINVADIPPGIYMLRIVKDRQIMVRKIIKQ